MPTRPPLYIQCTVHGTPLPNQAGQNGHCFCTRGNDPRCCFCTQLRSTLRQEQPIAHYSIETSGHIDGINRSTDSFWRQDNVEPEIRQSQLDARNQPLDFGAYFNAAQNIFTYRPRTEGGNTAPNTVYAVPQPTAATYWADNDKAIPPEVQGDFDDDGSFELKDQ